MRRRTALLFAGLLVLVAAVVVVERRRRVEGPGPAPATQFHLEPVRGEAVLVGDGASTKMRAIAIDVPGVLTWRVRVPPSARLETHLSFARAVLPALEGLTCRVRVEVTSGARPPATVLEREVSPGPVWEPIQADLHAQAAAEAELLIGLDCPGRGSRTFSGAARWSVPILSSPPSPRDVNVLLVSIDTLRADHLHAYGYARPTSPNIDALAGRGLLFQNAETVQSATWPALTSLHTSLYPSAHGVLWNGHRMPDGLLTLAEALHARQYSTSAFITNMTRARHPGFSRLYLARGEQQSEMDRRVVEEALGQLRKERERRFFMWVHLLSPHAGYAPPPPHDRAFTRPGAKAVNAEIDALVALRRAKVDVSATDLAELIALYDGEVAWVDELVGRLLRALRELSLDERTLVVVTADHGEDLYEHNRYFFHSPSIYGSSMRVPLILSLPGVLPQGQVTEHPASLVDVAPTLLGLLELPAVPHFQGLNLLPRRALPERPVRESTFGETNGKIFTLRTPEWRFVHNPERLHPAAPGGDYPIAEIELYDQKNDPKERRNLAVDRPDLVRALTTAMHAFKSQHLRKNPATQGLDPEALEELRALGYLAQ